jgi:hypothetical protein
MHTDLAPGWVFLAQKAVASRRARESAVVSQRRSQVVALRLAAS